MLLTIKKIRNIIRQWYVPLIIGIMFNLIAFGIFLSPNISIPLLMLLFSITLIIFGFRELFFIVQNRKTIKSWVLYLFASIIVIIAGAMLVGDPLLTLEYIKTLIITALLLKAIQNFILLYKFCRKSENDIGFNWIYSLALILIAAFLWVDPQVISSFLVTLSGLPFLIIGIACVSFSLILRKSHIKLNAFKKSFKKQTEDADFEIIN